MRRLEEINFWACFQRRSLAPSTTAKRLIDDSDYENDSDDYDDEDGSRRKGKRKRNEKPKKVKSKNVL